MTDPRAQPKVFISYVREDSAQVDKMCEALDRRGLRYWRDRTSLVPGSNWRREIERAIEGGALFLACFQGSRGE